MTDDKLKQIQLIEQNMQLLGQQKQQFQSQLIETQSATKELEKTDESYKIIGNIMVRTPKEKLAEELKEREHILDLRIQTIEKQERSMKTKFKDLQSEVMESMKG